MSAAEKPRRRTRFYTSSLIWDTPLRPADIAVFAFLSWCADAEGRSFPSVAEIARRCGMCTGSVRESIRRLKEKKLITVTPQMLPTAGGGIRRSSNLYLLPTDNTPRTRCSTPLHHAKYPPSQDGEHINNININGDISVSRSLSNYSVGNEGCQSEGETELCFEDALGSDTVSKADIERELACVPDQDRAPERGTRPCSDSAKAARAEEPECYPAEPVRDGYFEGMSFYDPPGRLPDFDVAAAPPELPEEPGYDVPGVFGVYPPLPVGAEDVFAPRGSPSSEDKKSLAYKGKSGDTKDIGLFSPERLEEIESELRLEELIYGLDLYLYEDRAFAEAVELTLRDMWDAEYTVIQGSRIPRDKVRERLRRLNTDCIDNVCRALERYEDVTAVSRYLAVCLYNAPRDAAADLAGLKRSMGIV